MITEEDVVMDMTAKSPKGCNVWPIFHVKTEEDVPMNINAIISMGCVVVWVLIARWKALGSMLHQLVMDRSIVLENSFVLEKVVFSR